MQALLAPARNASMSSAKAIADASVAATRMDNDASRPDVGIRLRRDTVSKLRRGPDAGQRSSFHAVNRLGFAARAALRPCCRMPAGSGMRAVLW